MKRIGFLLPLALLLVTGCDALTAHTSVAAKAGSQELSTERLADLIGKSTVPLDTNMASNEAMARAVADVWVNYQLLGLSAAKADTLRDVETMDAALWQQINSIKAAKLAQAVAKARPAPDTVVTEAEYRQGEMLSAAHILLMFPPGATPAQTDSVKNEAAKLRRTVTAANFAEMVKKHSKDTGSLDNNGLYAAFPRGMMAKEFEDGVLALEPGEISQPIQTMYGYHIIRRPLFEEVRAEHSSTKAMMATRLADSLFRTGRQAEIEVKKNAAALIKEIAPNVHEHADGKAVLATYPGGKYTSGDFARLVRSVPDRPRVIQDVLNMPDSVVPMVMKEVVFNDHVVPRMADSANLAADSTELAGIRGSLTNLLVETWRQLGVEPTSLGDPTATESDKLKEAAVRIDAYVDGMMATTARYVPVPDPLETLLRESHSNSISASGLRRALEQAMQIRAAADSVRAVQRENAPGSMIPMPGGGVSPGTVPPPSGGGAPPPGTGRGGG